MEVNALFGPRRTNIPHKTHKYGPGKSKFEVHYYRQTYSFPEKVAHIRKTGKEGLEVIYSSKCFNSNYMEFLVIKYVIN